MTPSTSRGVEIRTGSSLSGTLKSCPPAFLTTRKGGQTMKVINAKYLPAQLPLTLTLVSILALDRWNANGVWWGVICTILVIFWIAAIWKLFTQDAVKPNEI
jgi:hypothetical protein